jgi:putative phosphoesterase
MKVLLVSDIHSNVQAFLKVLNNARYDAVLFIGDLVDYGPDPFDCWVTLRYAKAKRVLGNHDAAAAFGIDCRSGGVLRDSSVLTRKLITATDMPKETLELLAKAETKLDVDYDGFRVRAVHGVPGDELYTGVTKEEAANLEMDGADLIVLGHTHVAYEVRNSRTWVVNPGSVGMPLDGDPRASYALLDTEARTIKLERVEYDVEATLTRLEDLLKEEKPAFEFLARIFRTGSVSAATELPRDRPEAPATS